MTTRRSFMAGLGASASSIYFCNCCNAQEITTNPLLNPQWDRGGKMREMSPP